MQRNVIVDLDAGSDDAVALLLLLTSEINLNFKVIGVTCTTGNTDVDYVCANVLRTLETIERQDVSLIYLLCCYENVIVIKFLFLNLRNVR